MGPLVGSTLEVLAVATLASAAALADALAAARIAMAVLEGWAGGVGAVACSMPAASSSVLDVGEVVGVGPQVGLDVGLGVGLAAGSSVLTQLP
eukprot:5599514-Alexandrium_andersonii.AAC.1